jgi:glucose-1-phosphatase
MSKPNIVVFDLGKVLVDFDYSIAGQRIAAQSDMSASDVQTFLDQSPLLVRYETGQVTRQGFFDEVRKTMGFRGSIEQFAGFFADIFTAIPPMIELHALVRQKRIPTYIFSNTNDLAITHVRRRFPFFSNFDGYILSHEVGAMKPDVKMYSALERLTGFRGSYVLYVDDRPENIAAGAARGWQTILHETPEKTRTAMQEFGLLKP